MMHFPDLPEAIARAGQAGSSLKGLAESPTSKAAVSILAERTNFTVLETISDHSFTLDKCEDRATAGLSLPSPFAVLCLNTNAIVTQQDRQDLMEQILGLLRDMNLHFKPVLVLTSTELGLIRSLLETSGTTFVVLDSHKLVRILLAHPPRTILMRFVRDHIPLTLINPYFFQGPIVKPNMFVGRQDQLNKLCSLQTSYALIGPRAIGKTSLMHRARDILKQNNKVAISVELSPAMSEHEFLYHIIDRFIRDYGAKHSLLNRISFQRLERLIEDISDKHGTFAIFVDEADELPKKHQHLMDIFRHCHNEDWARIVLLGYKDLRKTINDTKNSSLNNLCHELPLSGLSLRECAGLVTDPMIELGIILEHPEKIVESIYQHSGGSPSRIQMLCHFLLESIGDVIPRTVSISDAEGAIGLP